MPKYIIPFVDPNQWQTSRDCPLCQAADIAYRNIMAQKDSFIQQKQIEELENVLVDGYGLLRVYEANGFAVYRKNDIERIKLYTAVNDLFMTKVGHYFNPSYPIPASVNIDLPVLNHSRWCRYCGLRKPDIYNSTLTGDDDLTNILDFKAEFQNDSTAISWKDIKSNNWHKSRIIRKANAKPENDNDGDIIEEYTTINKYSTNPFVDTDIDAGNVYYYQIYSYDILENILCSTQILPVLFEDLSYEPPELIDEFDARQERHIEFLEDGTPVIRDYVISRWPSTQPCDGVTLRYNNEYDMPLAPWEGFATEEHTPVNLGYNDGKGLELGSIYSFRPFPYKNVHYIHTELGIEYIDGKDYNYDSKPSYIRIQQHIELPKNISVIGGDGRIDVKWTDPEPSSWVATKVLYKKGSMIVSDWDPDAILAATVVNKNAYSEVSFTITDIENGEDYYVGIFPINIYDLCNVNIDNQVMVSTGYEMEDIVIDLNDPSSYNEQIPIMNFWYIDDYEEEKVLHSPALAKGENDYISLFEYALKYGATLSFKYKIFTYRKNEYPVFNVLIHGKKTTYSTRFVWTEQTIKLPATDYLNIKFQFISGSNKSNEDYVLLKDIKIVFNKKK